MAQKWGKVVMDIKHAVRIAKDHISELFGPVASLRLEEVSLEHDDSWYVTISFVRLEQEEPASLGDILEPVKLPGKFGNRDYKRVEIDDATARVMSIAVREFN